MIWTRTAFYPNVSYKKKNLRITGTEGTFVSLILVRRSAMEWTGHEGMG